MPTTSKGEDELNRELLLIAIGRTYDWKLCRMVMLLRLLQARQDLAPKVLPSEFWNSDDNLLRDGLMLDITSTCWEVGEALTGLAQRVLAGEPSVVKALIEYRPGDSKKFIDRLSKLTDSQLGRLFKPTLSPQDLKAAKSHLFLLEKFMRSSYSAAMKAKHGGVTLIGWDQGRKESSMPSSVFDERTMFASLIDYEQAKVILKWTSVSELDEVGNAIWWLYDHMIAGRTPEGGVRIKAHPALRG